MSGRVEGKAAVVTGAGSGIGRACAIALAREGASVIVADVDAAAADAVAAEIGRAGGAAHAHTADVRDLAQVEAMVGACVERFGRIDVLHNNAGIATPGSVHETSEDDWLRVLDVNLSGVWRGMRCAVPHMLAQGGGSIVNTGSVQAVVGYPGWAAYTASKAGIEGLTLQAAVEYGTAGIRVNAIIPGSIRSAMNQALLDRSPDPAALQARWDRQHALGRIGEPEEVASLVVYLASDESSFVTGAMVRVDGGMIVRGMF